MLFVVLSNSSVLSFIVQVWDVLSNGAISDTSQVFIVLFICLLLALKHFIIHDSITLSEVCK